MKWLIGLAYAWCSFLSINIAWAQESFTVDRVCRAKGRSAQSPSPSARWRILAVDYLLISLDSGKKVWSLQEVVLMGHADREEPLVLPQTRFSTDTDVKSVSAWVIVLPEAWRTALQADRLVICGSRADQMFTVALVHQQDGLLWCHMVPYGGFEDRDRRFATYSPDLSAGMRCFRPQGGR